MAEPALPHSAIHAEKFGAEEASAQLAQTYLKDIAAGLKERGLPIQTETIGGRPYLETVCHAEDGEIDLIVMSTRGHSGLSRWLLGSFTDRVVRGATVPLLLVQCQEDPGMGDDQHS
jgi:nucleotide-binding universal stress UspA family protein